MSIQRTGHVAIWVRDIEAAKRFYGEILGMELAQEIPGQGLFFRFNNYHHDLAVFKGREGTEPVDKNHAGIAHIALLAEDFETVKKMYHRLKEHGVPITMTIDHGMTKSIYFTDPDGIPFEIYCEVPEFDFRSKGLMNFTPLDLEDAPSAKA